MTRPIRTLASFGSILSPPPLMRHVMAEQNNGESNPTLLTECQTALDYQFRDDQLLTRCLTHASISRTRLESNERLEFLGDAILGAVVCEALFREFPDFPEGELTRIKSIVVSRSTCAKVSSQLDLHRFLLIGKGVGTRQRVPSSILAAVYESLVAGIYLDGGLEAARTFVERTMLPHIRRATESRNEQNFKSLLQQFAQKTCGETPVYRVLDEKGPDHSKCFQVAAVVGPRTYTSAWGPSKKEAEQSAAKNAYEEIRGEQPG